MASHEFITLRKFFPSLADVTEKLYPEALSRRPTITEYKGGLHKQGRLTPAVGDAIEKAREISSRFQVIFYIAGPLTGVDEETKARYGEVAELLKKFGNTFFGYVPHLHGTDPVKHPNVTPPEVRDIDSLWASVVAKWHINFLTPVAHGNAIEEGWAEGRMIPTCYIFPADARLSRLTRGMNNIAEVFPYQTIPELLNRLSEYFKELATWMKTFPQRDFREFFYLSYPTLRNPTLIMMERNPLHFSPFFDIHQFRVYVKDPNDPLYSQVGTIEGHDWRESGTMWLKFRDNTLEVYDQDPKLHKRFSFWI